MPLVLLLCLRNGVAQNVVDAGAWIHAAQERMGSAPGLIVLDRPSRLTGDVELASGHGLRIAAPLSVGHASIQLRGQNNVVCDAPVEVDQATDLFTAEGVTDIHVRGCNVTVRDGAGGYLVTATRAQRVVVTDNHLMNMALFTTHNLGGPASQTTDVTVNGNSTEFTRGSAPIGVYLMYVLRGTVSNNRFRGTGHGIEWWGGDGNLGWRGPAEVTRAGDLSITGNQCFSAGGACVWGSMGFNITVTGNSADLCSDVCFDSEGGVRNLFTGNTAQACGNGCYSVQMESEDVVFSGNYAYADAKAPALALILIKHHNENPAPHTNLTITGNTLVCGTLCTAFYSEGEDGLDLSHNTVVNGIFRFANYTGNVHVADNNLTFRVPLGSQPALQGPSLFNAHQSVLERNTFSMQMPDPQSVCIAQSWSDDNNSDTMLLSGNTCLGFGTGIFTETAGHNNGAPHAVWVLQHNSFFDVPAARALVHTRTSGNESYVTDPEHGS